MLQGVLDSVAELGEKRSELHADLGANYDRDRAIEGYAGLVAESERLLNEVQDYSPPGASAELHNTALTALEHRLEWMRLELKTHESGTRPLMDTADAMGPELIARDYAFRQGVSNTRSKFNLTD